MEGLKIRAKVPWLVASVLLAGVVAAGVQMVPGSMAENASRCSPAGGLEYHAANGDPSPAQPERDTACQEGAADKVGAWLSEQTIDQLAPSASDPDANPRLLGVLETRTGQVPVVRVNDATSRPCPRSLALSDVRPLARTAIRDFEAQGRRVGIVTVFCEGSELKVGVTADHPIPN